MTPTHRNRAPVMMPWLTIWRMAPCMACCCEDEDAQRHEAHVADRAVRHQLLEVRLHDGHDGAVDDGDEAEHDDEARQVVRRLRVQRQREADEAVAAQLEHHARPG